jgi:hypothetical protein
VNGSISTLSGHNKIFRPLFFSRPIHRDLAAAGRAQELSLGFLFDWLVAYMRLGARARYEKTKPNKTGHPSKLVLKQQTEGAPIKKQKEQLLGPVDIFREIVR